jgi:branched-chain amino acid transport system ATP-binding protein
MGLARTFQEMKLWRHMSVLDHVKMARYSKLTYGLLGAFFDTPATPARRAPSDDGHGIPEAMFGVDQFADQLVVNLPYGAQRRVEMARAMVTEPKVLLLDEPTVGMTPDELMDMIAVVRQAHERFNLAIFLIEHRLRVVMRTVPARTGPGVRGGAGGGQTGRGPSPPQGHRSLHR